MHTTTRARPLLLSTALLAAAAILLASPTPATARSLFKQQDPKPASDPVPVIITPATNEPKETGKCTADDEANPASRCGAADTTFTCGNSQEKSVWSLPSCPGTTVQCRVSADKPSVCAGDTVTVTDNGAAGIVINAPGTIAGPVNVKGGNGFCTFPSAYGSTQLRAPSNCGSDKHQCPAGHVDFCYCQGAPPTFVQSAGIASSMPADALPCQPMTLATMTAVDACGLPVPVTATIANTDVASVSSLSSAPGATIEAHGLACGHNLVTFTAKHPNKPSLMAEAFHTVHVADPVVPSAMATGRGSALCMKTFQTECISAELVPVVSLSGCTLTAKYAPQTDACNNVHKIDDETLVLSDTCA